jgi:hypothetical protein
MLRRPPFLILISGMIATVTLSWGLRASAQMTENHHVATAPVRDNADETSVFNRLINVVTSYNSEIGKAMDPSPVCKDCANLLKNNEQCTSGNSYLQEQLSDLKDNPVMSKVLAMPDSEDTIRTECIQIGMEVFPAGRSYRTCRPGQRDARSFSPVGKPCVSADYVNVTAKSFNAVAECLSGYVNGSDKRLNRDLTTMAIYQMINVESGFHVNAVSPTGAGGPGQFTQPAIQTVNQNMSALVSYLSKSSNPICNDALVKALRPPMSDSPSHSCERISLQDNNPLRNLIYIYAYQAVMHRGIEGLFSGPAYAPIVDQLSADNRERLISGLATWSHNTGLGGMQVPLRALLWNYVRSGKVLKNRGDIGHFLDQLQQNMLTHPHPANNSPGRRRETYNYYSAIFSRAETIGKHLNGGLKRCYNE